VISLNALELGESIGWINVRVTWMNGPETSEGLTRRTTEPVRSNAARLVRSIHMFTGLFLAPWMLMYAISTLDMTHQEFVHSLYRTKDPTLTTEKELDYSRLFSPGTPPAEIGHQILIDVGLDGTHRVSGGKNGKPLVIVRQNALGVHRLTYDAAKHQLLIQREEFRSSTFLERMHRRRGYDQPYALEDTWGFSVDVAVVAMIFWSLSGLWLWWELKATRGWGTLAMAGGWALFAIFLLLL
jgi:hypothetical protein